MIIGIVPTADASSTPARWLRLDAARNRRWAAVLRNVLHHFACRGRHTHNIARAGRKVTTQDSPTGASV